MIALLLATEEEARALLRLLDARPLAGQPFKTYAFAPAGNRPEGVVVISGMGPAQAAAATAYAVTSRGAKSVMNIGICGALAARLQPGQACRVDQAADGDALSEPLRIPADPAWADLPAVRLLTLREPVFSEERRSALAPHGDVVDMEGHAIVRACRELGVPCQLIKGVSDRADATGRDELRRNLSRVSDALAQRVVAALDGAARPRQSLAARIANFVKIEHTIFSLPLLFAGAWLGAGNRWPGLRLLGLIALAGLGARTLGMAMNRILDRHIDRLNPRTAGRELPAGRLSTAQAWAVAAGGLAAYLVACAALGPICLAWSPLPAAVLISYSLLKRITSLCHLGIGLCLALGPVGAYVAASGRTDASAPIVLLAIYTFCWISGFDIIYSLQDLAFDRQAGVHSMPAALGSRGAQWVAAVLHLGSVASLAWLWQIMGGGIAPAAALGVAVAAFALAYFQKIPLHVRFFPISAIAGIAGSLVPLLGGLR